MLRPCPEGLFCTTESDRKDMPASAFHLSTAASRFLFSIARASPLLLFLAACAVPQPPQGGPQDQTPPAFVTTEPVAGAVNVVTRTLHLTFSEYVDQGSFQRAFSLTPEPERPPTFRWKGRRVAVQFQDSLRVNTTYILTLDTGLRDAHGVSLREPLTLAFSTGPTINRGQLAGQVLDAATGRGLAGVEVFAYLALDSLPPATLPERPDYRTQTDASGQFHLSYLAEAPFFVLAVQDRNRNRRPDAGEGVAVPPLPVLQADTARAVATLRWLVAVQDTIPPMLRQVQALSSRRLALRFDDPVRLATVVPDGWLLEDSVAGQPVPVRALYTLSEGPREVYALTDSLRAGIHHLTPAGIVDSSGNRLAATTARFTVSATADTMRLRFQRFLPDPVPGQPLSDRVLLAPADALGVRFNQAVDPELLRQVVAVEDSLGQTLTFTPRTDDGSGYWLDPVPPLAAGQVVRLHVRNRALGLNDTTFTQTYERRTARQLGELSGVVAAPEAGPVVVELYTTPARRLLHTATLEQAGRFVFRELPEGTYRLRTYLDRNASTRWDGGRLTPWQAAEPLAWSADTLRVRPRWENTLPDTLRIR